MILERFHNASIARLHVAGWQIKWICDMPQVSPSCHRGRILGGGWSFCACEVVESWVSMGFDGVANVDTRASYLTAIKLARLEWKVDVI